MLGTRKVKSCKRCNRGWLLEGTAPKYTGDGLAKFERERSRKWNRCYCGEALYN